MLIETILETQIILTYYSLKSLLGLLYKPFQVLLTKKGTKS